MLAVVLICSFVHQLPNPFGRAVVPSSAVHCATAAGLREDAETRG